MAVAARDIPITRDMVAAWIEEARVADVDVKAHVREQVLALNLDDPYVDVRARSDQEGSKIHVADLIEQDLDSYG